MSRPSGQPVPLGQSASWTCFSAEATACQPSWSLAALVRSTAFLRGARETVTLRADALAEPLGRLDVEGSAAWTESGTVARPAIKPAAMTALLVFTDTPGLLPHVGLQTKRRGRRRAPSW